MNISLTEEREAGMKLLTRFDILQKYDIKHGDFKKMSQSPLFPKHYEYDGAWLYVETEIQVFFKDYGEQK
ncbi:hypothetical protein FACS1894122_05340 [Alphaproteobacteria bacterium]|nr:hypothetical protein FACS1894122_05340 [Alphaproteobacteria bacterium]